MVVMIIVVMMLVFSTMIMGVMLMIAAKMRVIMTCDRQSHQRHGNRNPSRQSR